MTGFLRPEVRALLRRWREVLGALGVAGLGLWVALRPGPILQGFGWVLLAAGLAALLPALRRARFASSGEGPGVVTVDERRIVYMGPVHGGTIALDEMTALALRRGGPGRAAWVLTEPAALLVIPVDARGAEALFDDFTALPGLSAEALLAARAETAPGTARLWVRAGAHPGERALTR